jgi:hypothetical protein
MSDYGLKVSKHNHDIGDGDRYQIMNTKYPVLKLKLSGQGTLSYVAGQSNKIVEITHDLGYVPICFVSGQYFDVDTASVPTKRANWNRWFYRGLQVSDYYYYYADTTKLYIVFVPAEGITDAYSFNLAYMYHIFYDEDTL